MLSVDATTWGFLAGLALIAGLEALPAWGRWVPGHYGIALVVALAVALDLAPPWVGAAALLGAWVSDVAVFVYEQRMRLVSPHGHGAWWRAGLDMDDLVQWIRATPLRTFLLAKFSTKHRARLPSAAARMQLPFARFASLSFVGCVVFCAVWVGVGLALGYAASFAPREAVLIGACVLFVLMTAPGLRRRVKPGRDDAWFSP